MCSRCGAEVRWGRRDGAPEYLHREAVDHPAVLGHTLTEADAAEIERQRHLERTRETKDGIETYTIAAIERAKAPGDDEEGVEPEPVPEPEVARHDVTADDFPPRSGIRQVANLVAKTPGWEVARFTACRGPYLGAKGKVLSISDHVVLGARGPRQVDGSRPIAVASWRDGAFESGYIGTLRNGRIESIPTNSTDMKGWIKREAYP